MAVTPLRRIEAEDRPGASPPPAASIGGFGWLCLVGLGLVGYLLVTNF